MLEPLDKTMFWQFDEESVYLDIEIETSEGAQENVSYSVQCLLT